MLFYLGILTGLITLYLVDIFVKRIQINKYTGKFPSSPRHVILGNLPNYQGKDASGIFYTLMSAHKHLGPNLATWGLLNAHQLSITSPTDVQAILSSSQPSQKSHDYQFLHSWLGQGLLSSSGTKWQIRRKNITPSFHFQILEQFIRIFNEQSSIMVEKLKNSSINSQEVNIYQYSTLCALDIISEAAMGVKISAQDNPDTEYVRAVKEMSRIIFARAFSVLSQFVWTFPFTKLYQDERQVLKVLHGFTDEVIRKRREQLKTLSKNKEEIKRKMTKKCFLDTLLDSSLTTRDIREEVDTFLFGGHDTTTSGISFTLYHLSRNEEIQEKVYEEIVKVLEGKIKEDITASFDYSTLQKLKYLEMVIKESMRITPPVPMIGRELTEDTVIEGVTVLKGTTINIPIYAMHHSEDVFPDPEIFRPERFSQEESEGRHPYAYIPFSAGNRNCMGQKFAMWEIKTVVAKMVLNYKLRPGDQEVVLQADLVLRSANGVTVRVEKRISGN